MDRTVWEALAGSIVGQKYTLGELMSVERGQAKFLARSLRPPYDQIVVAFFPADEEGTGWPDYVLHLHHPHLRSVLCAGQEAIRGEEWRWIAMEPAGTLLSERLSKEGPLSLAVARDLTVQLIDALHYLRENSLVYRNV